MSPRVLNIIIVLSIIGMLLIVVKEKYYPRMPASNTSGNGGQESAKQDPNQTQIDAATSTKSDPEVPCKSAYFNFNPTSTWKYTLSTGSTFTSTIASASASTVTVASKLPTEKKPLNSTLTCKESGIYGLPFIPTSSKTIPQSVIDSIMLIPNSKELTKGQSWTSAIDIGMQIPFISGKGITIKSTVEKVTDVSAIISSTLDLGSIPASVSPVGNGKILEYTLVKGVGVSNLKLLIGKEAPPSGQISGSAQRGKTGSGFNVSLVGYSQK